MFATSVMLRIPSILPQHLKEQSQFRSQLPIYSKVHVNEQFGDSQDLSLPWNEAALATAAAMREK
jgi:hypothetical protein